MSNIEQELDKFFPKRWGYTENVVPLSVSNYIKWCEDGYFGELRYLVDAKRESLQNYMPSYRSALVFIFPYTKIQLAGEQQLASFVFYGNGEDYHLSITKELNDFAKKNCLENYKVICDTSPVLERDLAASAGLGFFGKSNLLINSKFGSRFLIGAILLSQKLDLSLGVPVKDGCGECKLCLDACPTGALTPYKLDCRKCLSAYSIEQFKDVLPPEIMKESGKFVFGCDQCLNACPWNQKVDKDYLPEQFKLFEQNRRSELIMMFSQMSNREYRRFFKNTSLERTGRVGMIKNLKHLP